MKKKTNPKKNETENPKSDSHLKDPNWKWSHLDWSDWEDGTLDSEGRIDCVF